MDTTSYLETLPVSRIARYRGGPPRDTVPFTGFPQQHPSDKYKLILVNDPLGDNPAVMEFKLDDVLYAEEVHSAVTEEGEGVPLIKLWIRRGARGVVMEPFEVQDPIRFVNKASGTGVKQRTRFLAE
jgi:inorganic pyrophosphatase